MQTRILVLAVSSLVALLGCSQDFCVDVLKGCSGASGTGSGGAPSSTSSSGATTDASSSTTVTGPGSSGSTTSAQASTGTGIATTCIPSQVTGGIVDDACGVFVNASQGSDAGAGTKSDPLASLEKATLAVGGKSAIYLCEGNYAGGFEIPIDVSLFGGLDCTTFGYQTTKKSVIAGASGVPTLTMSGAGETHLGNVDVSTVASGAVGNTPIGVLVSNANLTIEGCSVTADGGGPGSSGADAPPTPMQANGTNGKAGHKACFDPTDAPGGPSVTHACPGMIDTIGGSGGDGKQSVGGDGAAGIPALGAGQGGLGQSAAVCQNGITGADGPHGAGGLGASDKGTLDASGYVASAGAPGAPGSPAQGGGGGGGAKGPADCSPMPGNQPGAGASGGSGGTGGCGGLPGQGGLGAGSSFAVVSLSSQLTIVSSDLRSNTGGNGGNGGG